MYVTEHTRLRCFNTALHSYSTYAKSSSFNDAVLYVHSDVSTVGVWAIVCVLWGVMRRGRSVCDCVWGVETGDRHADVWVLLDGACRVGRCARLLLLLRSFVVLTLSYNLDYG